MVNLRELLDPLALAVLTVTVVLFPWSGVWEHRRLARWIAAKLPNARLRHYRGLMAWEWGTVAVFLMWWFASGRPADELGLVPDPTGWQWLAVASGAALSVLLVWQMNGVRRNPAALVTVRAQLDHLRNLVPRNGREQRAFDGLSVTAGVCEEILYRGLVLALLIGPLGTWPAVLVSSVVFGLGHLYQGLTGFVKTSMVGLVLALLTVFSGSLITAVVVHAVLDLTSGRIMRASVERPADPASASS